LQSAGSSSALAIQVAPYFYTWGYGNSAYKITSLMDAKTKIGLNSATLAFIISGGGCQINPELDLMIADVKSFLAAGGELIISFGGASGPYLEDTCQDETQLFNTMDSLIQRTGIYSLDFDIEGAYIANPILTTRRNNTILKLQAKYPQLHVSFTLPVIPPSPWDAGGLDTNGMNLMKAIVASGVKVSVLNMMTMDYYSNTGKTHAQLAIAITDQVVNQLKTLYPSKTTAQLYSMIGITPMIGYNDDNTLFSLADTQEVVSYAISKKVGLLSFWALQRDQLGSGSLPLYSGANKTDFEFYSVFKEAAGEIPIPIPTIVPTPTPKPTQSPTPKPTKTPKPKPTKSPKPTPSPVPVPVPVPVATPNPEPVATPEPTSNPKICQPWVENKGYQAGDVVTYQGQNYTCTQTHFAWPGTNWNPVSVPSLWSKGGTCE
jgi:chitinase